MEKLQVRCPSCDRKILFEEKHRGRRAKCPNCSGLVHLEPSVASEGSAAVIDDPFAEMADASPHPAPPRPAPPDRRRTTGTSSQDAHGLSPQKPKPRKSLRGSSPLPEPTSQSAGDVSDVDPDPNWHQTDSEEFSAAGESTQDEGYFDELGLGELAEIQSYAEPDPATLPPVKKQFIKKPKKKAVADESEEAASSAKPKKSRTPKTFDSPPAPSSGRWLVYALFFMTLIPLGVSILMPDDQSVQERINQSLEQADESGEWSEEQFAEGEPVGVDELIVALPGHRVAGAFLARDTWMHWVFAAISGIGFLMLFLALFRRFHEALGGAVAGAAFTATVGIVLLLGLQWAAMFSQGMWIRGRSIIVLLFYLVKFIGFSYRCALEEGSNFMSSFMGFTLGVGICEELCKILPVIVYLGTAKKSTWQGTCLVGLASGVGFGVAEGIMYSSSYYNGISGGDIYLVRFISCVALHAVWTGAGSVLLYFNQDSLHGGEWSDVLFTLAVTLGASIILHGLYDTLLKQNLEIWALVTGAVSVAWLIGVVEKQSQIEGAY